MDLSSLGVDPSPAQFVDATTLHAMHTVFTLMCVHLAYITRGGRLVGVVGMEEVSLSGKFREIIRDRKKDLAREEAKEKYIYIYRERERERERK